MLWLTARHDGRDDVVVALPIDDRWMVGPITNHYIQELPVAPLVHRIRGLGFGIRSPFGARIPTF